MTLATCMKRTALVLALALLAACQSEPLQLTTQAATVTLGQDWAARGETVTATLKGVNARDARVFVAGIEATITNATGSSLDFLVPEGAAAGRQPVEINVESQMLHASLSILGDDVVQQEAVVIFQPGMSASEIEKLLRPLGFELLEGPRPLGMAEGPCAGDLVRLRVTDTTTGKGLKRLDPLVDDGVVRHIDPQTGYDSGTINHLQATGAKEARLERNLSGAGTVVAVLDTGVNPHEEFGERLLAHLGYDFVNEDATPEDNYDDPSTTYAPDGHGTAIAQFAAGDSFGVAPAAQILAVKVCDDRGVCLGHDAILGTCHALARAEADLGGMENLVLNLSFGGDTPSPTLEAVLDFALQNGTLVAAAGGNRGQEGSPAHYPAASDLPGLVAVAALQSDSAVGESADWYPAAFSNRGEYLDIAAPGVDLLGATPPGSHYVDYDGTSFASALVAGGLALWREANPGMSSADVEAGLKAAAWPLAYPENEVGAGMLDLSEQPR